MARKILTGLWLGLCGALFVLSFIGIGTIWKYKKPLTVAVSARLTEIDAELGLAQTSLQNAQGELKRALRFVDTAEEALANFSEQTAVAREFLDTVTEVLDETIKPSLATSKEKLDEAQQTMDDLRASIQALNRIPFVNLAVPDDELLGSFTEIIDSLEGEITRVETIADQASAFMNDGSYLMGGDLNETRTNIQELQTVVTDYERKIGTWREQLDALKAKSPGWIQRTAIFLTVFLLWFALSQFGLILHGLAVRRGENPLAVLQMENAPESD
jgi:chromosome segregation ATPase